MDFGHTGHLGDMPRLELIREVEYASAAAKGRELTSERNEVILLKISQCLGPQLQSIPKPLHVGQNGGSVA